MPRRKLESRRAFAWFTWLILLDNTPGEMAFTHTLDGPHDERRTVFIWALRASA